MRHLRLRVVLPLGMALLLLLVVGGSVLNALDKRMAQLDQQARRDLRVHSTHIARMASEGWDSSRGLVETDLAQEATDPRTEVVMLLDETGRVLAANHYAWRGRPVAEVMPEFDLKRFTTAKAGRLPIVYDLTPDRTRIAAMQPFSLADDPQRVRSQHTGVVYISFDLVRERQLMRLFVFKARAPDIAATMILLLLLAWLLQRKSITAPIVSATSLEQLKDLLAAPALKLDADSVRAALPEVVGADDVHDLSLGT